MEVRAVSEREKLLRDEITNAREASKKLYELVHKKYQNDASLILLTSVLEDATQNAFSLMFDN